MYQLPLARATRQPQICKRSRLTPDPNQVFEQPLGGLMTADATERSESVPEDLIRWTGGLGAQRFAVRAGHLRREKDLHRANATTSTSSPPWDWEPWRPEPSV